MDCAQPRRSTAKGGGFMIGVGPSAHGEFHPEAIRQMKGAGAWLKVNGEAIYATRPREGTLWSEGETVRYHALEGSAATLRNPHRVARNAGHAQDRAAQGWIARNASRLECRIALEVRFRNGDHDHISRETSAARQSPLRTCLDAEDRTSRSIVLAIFASLSRMTLDSK